MKTKRVIVVPYDLNWAYAFEQIAGEIQNVLGDLAVKIHHVGSTSVPGMSAKPIIDLDVEIRNESVLPAVIARLAEIGYEHEGNLGIVGREAFRYDDKNHLMKHHLYVCSSDSAELKRHLTFRDYLREHPEEAKEYSAVKEEAARRYPDSIDDYISYKSDCIEKIYQKCGL